MLNQSAAILLCAQFAVILYIASRKEKRNMMCFFGVIFVFSMHLISGSFIIISVVLKMSAHYRETSADTVSV